MKNNCSTEKQYDLEERTYRFARDVRLFVRMLAKTTANNEDGKQLIRSSGSVGANYREANEALSKKDCIMRMKISRKEAKESIYWLRLILDTNNIRDKKGEGLLKEAGEIRKIMSAIILKLTNSKSQNPNSKATPVQPKK